MAVWTDVLGKVAGAALRFLRPPRDGYEQIKGLHGPVDILTDRYGVPHVYAGDLHDVFFAQGFVHARERLWQMDLNRRVGQGRLSQVFGPDSLAADRFVRRVGLHRLAEAHWLATASPTREYLQSYSAGVNRAMEGLRPPEFYLLKLRPLPWKPQDCLLWSKVMAFDMASNWESELMRAELIEKVGPTVAASFYQTYLPSWPVEVPPLNRMAEVPGELRQLYEEAIPWLSLGFGRFPGSNAWAVAGQRTATGQPLLANDPHLVLRLPSTWFEMHLECPEMSVYGATLPGMLGVILGHNRDVAWGVTNSFVDTQDLVVETLQGNTCRRPDGYSPIQEIVETIEVKGQAPHKERVSISDEGPFLFRGEKSALALRWTGYAAGSDTSTAAVLELNQARSAEDVRRALSGWLSPCLNFVYADSAGNIGYQLAGAVPRRREGIGLCPVPGWESRFRWDGLLSFEELPHLENPPCGYVVSANNAVAMGSGPPLSLDWMGGYRAQRIEQVLQGGTALRAEDFSALQNDLHSLPGQALIELWRGWSLSWCDLPHVERAWKRLLQWDGQLAADSVGGCIHQFLLLELCRQAFLPTLGEELLSRWMGKPHSPLAQLGPYGGRYTGFLVDAMSRQDDSTLVAGDSWPQVVGRSLPLVVVDLTRTFGEDMDSWRWGQAHRLQLKHALGVVAQLAPFLNSPAVDFGGDTDTVCQSAVIPHKPYLTEYWAPSWRFIADLSDLSRATQSVLPSGQSGWPGDPHYLDHWPLWLAGQLHPALFHRGLLEDSRPRRLILFPLP